MIFYFLLTGEYSRPRNGKSKTITVEVFHQLDIFLLVNVNFKNINHQKNI